ncbi:MAG: YibE/F family protein [Oscillospiraceae bacterium]|jgi:uncharacterized membrane protein|nr:YibE/F family protein [Oscillospiraceae bacterium]
MKVSKRVLNIIIYFAIILFALLFLYAGNKIAVDGMVINYDEYYHLTVETKVGRVLGTSYTELGDTVVTFEATVTKGAQKGETLTATQIFGNHISSFDKRVDTGDKVILLYAGEEWHYGGYVKIDKIIILGAAFIVLLLFFGRIKGLNAILSLGFTCAAIFAVFIPSILSGKNIYVSSIIVCVYSIVVTLFIIYGVNIKSLAAVAGCFGGIVAAGLLTLFMRSVTGLTGMLDGESLSLLYLPTKTPIDLKAVIFAGIVIGAVGAVIDVAVSMASALWEIKEQAPGLKFADIFKSGVNIGKDIMGATTNTLVLAYIGSSLSVVLLLIVYAGSFTELLNRELVVVEFMQALIGSLGILLTMPLTALVCAALYSKKRNGGVCAAAETIQTAMRNNRQVAFKYRESDNSIGGYRFSPYKFLLIKDRYHILGYSKTHDKIVTLKVERICGINVSGEDLIPPPPDFDLTEFERRVSDKYGKKIIAAEPFLK